MVEINDRHEIFNPYQAPCDNCINGFDSFKYTCHAFLKGIPDSILSGKDKHLKPIQKQGNDLVYLPKEEYPDLALLNPEIKVK